MIVEIKYGNTESLSVLTNTDLPHTKRILLTAIFYDGGQAFLSGKTFVG